MRFIFRNILLFSAAVLVPAAGLSAPQHRPTAHRKVRWSGSARLARQIDSLLAAPDMAQAHWGISMTTLDGRVLYEKNDAQLFAPASNAKLFTTSAALALLGPNATVETRVIAAAGPDADGVIHGNVTLVGGGDTSMSGQEYPYRVGSKQHNPSLAALEALAHQVQMRDTRLVEGDIVGDDTAFPWEPYGAGWGWDDLEWDFGAPTSALSVNDNIVRLTVTPGAQAGDPVTFAWDPAVTASYYTMTNSAHTSAAGSAPSLGLDRPLGSLEFRMFGTLPAGGSPVKLRVSIQDPAKFAAIAFRRMLEARGIVVTGKAVAHHRPSIDTSIYEQSVLRSLILPVLAVGSGWTNLTPPLPPGEVMLASRTSVPLLEDITLTNKESQNLHAEMFLRLLGQRYGEDGSLVEGARVVRAFMLRAGVQPQDFFFFDGSGLSPKDRVTPRALTTLLRYAAAQPWGEVFRSTLPIGGVDGTLSSRFTQGPLRAHVFAKTGTLEEVNALSGYVAVRGGRTLVFSILVNGHIPDAKGITRTMDAILAAAAQADSVR